MIAVLLGSFFSTGFTNIIQDTVRKLKTRGPEGPEALTCSP